jgi:Protein tyrosine and serine/threonine kinase
MCRVYQFIFVWQSPNSTIKETDRKNVKLTVGGILIIIVCLLFLWIFLGKFACIKPSNVDDYLSIYTYRQIKNATKTFSTKLGGGFGSVFKGRFFYCTEVAVKKLKVVGQEEKQFRTEVQTLGMIRHTNLVGLLVYKYMSKGFLNSHLFKEGSIF